MANVRDIQFFRIVMSFLQLVSNMLGILNQCLAAMAFAASYKARDKIVKIQGFVETVVPKMLPAQFRVYFRMYPSTFKKLYNFLKKCPRMKRRVNKRSIPLMKKLYMTLYYLGNAESTYRAAHHFGVSEEAFIRAIRDVMLSFIDNVHKFIYWPEKKYYPFIASQFDKIGRWMPNVVACLDGCHLRYQVGKRHKRFYYTKHKKCHSINLMAFVTYNMTFIDIFVGWPGIRHDSGVFAHSPVYKLIRHYMTYGTRILSETFSILADKAFPLCPEIMTPFKGKKDVKLTKKQSDFNSHMNSKRQTVERAFSLLKRRFPRLRMLNQKSHLRAVTVVMAACIMHNICIFENDSIDHYLKAKRRGHQVQDWHKRPLLEGNRQDLGKIKRDLMAQSVQDHLNQQQTST